MESLGFESLCVEEWRGSSISSLFALKPCVRGKEVSQNNLWVRTTNTNRSWSWSKNVFTYCFQKQGTFIVGYTFINQQRTKLHLSETRSPSWGSLVVTVEKRKNKSGWTASCINNWDCASARACVWMCECGRGCWIADHVWNSYILLHTIPRLRQKQTKVCIVAIAMSRCWLFTALDMTFAKKVRFATCIFVH